MGKASPCKRSLRDMGGLKIFGNKFEMEGHIGAGISWRATTRRRGIRRSCAASVVIACSPLAGRRAAGGDRM
jgi:hypothetical protein